MFKRIFSTLMVLSMIIGLLGMTVIGVSAAHPFDDIPEWANEYVENVYAKGIMQGIGDTTFGSDGILTREQLVVTLYRLSGSGVKGTDASLNKHFADAADISTWAYDAVEWAYLTKITSGVMMGDELHFKPKNNVTRQEAAKFFVTYIDYMNLKAPTDNAADIKDIDAVDAWALPYVERCIAAGIINGDGNGNFSPYGN
ncbi:MAG: S-layer homology domain-containing protein, partial [Clostridia bacterium]|nr:S-layer homology domain-containing protein [Clostridia bacterium]